MVLICQGILESVQSGAILMRDRLPIVDLSIPASSNDVSGIIYCVGGRVIAVLSLLGPPVLR